MAYEAGNVVLKFVTDLSQARREMEQFKAEASRAIPIGGGGVANGPAGGIGATVRNSSGGSVGMGASVSSSLQDRLTDRFEVSYENRLVKDRSTAAAEAVSLYKARGSRSYSGRGLQGYNYDNPEDFAFRQQKNNEEFESRRSRKERSVSDAFDRMGDRMTAKGENAEARADDKIVRAKEKLARSIEKEADDRMSALEQGAAMEQSIGRRDAANLRTSRRRADLAEAPNARARVAMLDREMEGVDPDSVEYQNLRQQRAMAVKDMNVGGFLNRISKLGAVMFASREIGAAGRAYGEYRRFQTTMQYGGIDEQLGVLGGNLVDNAQFWTAKTLSLLDDGTMPGSLYDRAVKRTKSWGTDADEAVARAKEGVSRVRLGGELLKRDREARAGISAMNAESAGLDITDPAARARYEATSEQDAAQLSLVNERKAIEDRKKHAFTETERAQAASELRVFDSTAPGRSSAINNRATSKIGAIDRDEAVAKVKQDFANTSNEMGMKGFGREAAIAGVNAEFAPVFDKNGRIVAFGQLPPTSNLFAGMKKAYDLKMTAAIAGDKRSDYAEEGEVSSLDSAMGRNYLQSRLDKITAERKAALEGLDPSSDTFERRSKIYDAKAQLEERDQDDRDRLTQIGLDTRSRQLKAMNEHSPAGARIAGMVGETRSEIEKFTDEGEWKFAGDARQLGIDQLKLMAQQYDEGLQGRQLGSKFELDTQNVAGETPVVVLRRIEEAIKSLGGS